MPEGARVYDILYQVIRVFIKDEATARTIEYVILIGIVIYALQRYGAYTEAKRRRR